MQIIRFINLIAMIFFFASCSKEVNREIVIKEKSLDLQVIEVYNEGMKALEAGDVLFAAKKFNEAEILFPQSDWAPNSALMAAYAYYTQDYYSDVTAEIQRFLRVYPKHKNLDYAYYLLATVYYEQIVDEKKDLQSILKAKNTFEIVINKFPNTEYALDAKFKINLIDDILASKEMYIGRYYFDKKKWIPAINRFKTVIDDYDTTIYIEEALHRLVEIHYHIGLEKEAKTYASILGYNYNSSEWFDQSYKILNKNYRPNIKKGSNDKNSNLFKKIFKNIK